MFSCIFFDYLRHFQRHIIEQRHCPVSTSLKKINNTYISKCVKCQFFCIFSYNEEAVRYPSNGNNNVLQVTENTSS